MPAAIVVFPGSNRDRDMIAALTAIGGTAPAIVWHQDTELPPVDLIVIPGGFSYGDYLRAGAIAARSPIMGAIRVAAERGEYSLHGLLRRFCRIVRYWRYVHLLRCI